ncbi:hypothetical protein UN63_03900 [Oceanisphaera arctica]|uniref:Uncharacterized protein n=1 Tax=Oceanisphaera arctica TaxID=641510 RepID=A0A2P5TPV8_9GAMM|nr:hypothetical protein UN63_03900 [Oceanisphaera arctica]
MVGLSWGNNADARYGVWSQRGELFRQRILSLVETAKRLSCCPQQWLRTIVQTCIEKRDPPFWQHCPRQVSLGEQLPEMPMLRRLSIKGVRHASRDYW